MKLKTPKDYLLKAMNKNPSSVLIVYESGGMIDVDCFFQSPGQALFLLNRLEKHLKDFIDAECGGTKQNEEQR